MLRHVDALRADLLAFAAASALRQYLIRPLGEALIAAVELAG